MANLPEADQGNLDRMNAALAADPQFGYLSLHANNGDQSSLNQLKALAAAKGFPVPDNATWAAGRFQNSGGSTWKKPLALGALALGGMFAAPAIAGALGAGAGGGAAAAAPAAAGSTVTLPALTGGGLTIDGLTAGGTIAAGGGAAGAGGAGAVSTAKLLSSLGSAATSLSSGAASGRAAEATANQNQFGSQLKGLTAQLDRAKVAKSLQEQDYNDQLRGRLIAQLQGASAFAPPEVASHMGASPSPNLGSVGTNITNAATLDLLQKGDPNTGYTAASTAPMPTLPNLPSPNAATSALPYIGSGLSISALIKDYLNNQTGGVSIRDYLQKQQGGV